MIHSTGFREWLNELRFSRKVCMLIPMEACMGHPVAIVPGEMYLIPFFRVIPGEMGDRLSPPFAYIRVSYPDSTILTYNNLRTLPAWKQVNWQESCPPAKRCDAYYTAACAADAGQLDALLLKSLCPEDPSAGNSPPLVGWYEKLIDEAKKYR